MATSTGRAQLLERIERICRAPHDDRSLRLAVLAEVRRVVPFDAYVWVVTDPGSWVGCAPLADVPCLPELTSLIHLKYVTQVNRWTGLLPAAPPPGEQSAATLQSATGGRPERSLIWRKLLCRYEVVDVASLAFVDRYGCWAFLDLWRSRPGAPFDDVERSVLAAVTEPLTTALRGCQARTFSANPPKARPMGGAAVLFLGDDLQVLSQTDATWALLRSLNPPGNDRPAIPAVAYNVGAQLHAVERAVDEHDPSARVHLGDGLWLTLRAARIRAAHGRPGDGIAVTIEATSPGDRLDLFGRAVGLSPRETDLVRLISAGADTRRVSEALFISEYTVQDHLKAVFAKTGVRSRTALLAQALGRPLPES